MCLEEKVKSYNGLKIKSIEKELFVFKKLYFLNYAQLKKGYISKPVFDGFFLYFMPNFEVVFLDFRTGYFF